MASLTKDQVKQVAKLANLKLNEKEVAKFQKQLSEVLNYIAQLNELKTEGVEPTSQVTGLENVFRHDEPKSSLTQKEALSSAKSNDRGFFKIKSIF